MNNISPPSQVKVHSFLVLTTLFWGGSFLFTKIGLATIPPIHFVAFRFVLATLIMFLLSANRLPKITKSVVIRGGIVGLALGVTNIVFVFGLSGTSISRAGILNNLFVLFIPILSKLFWRDRIGASNIIGIMLAAGGIWLLASGGGGFSSGDLVSTICAFCIAIHILSVSKALKIGDDIYLVSLVQFATVAIISSTLVLIIPTPEYVINSRALLTVVYCAIFPTVLCFTLQNAFQRYTTPTRAGLIYTLDPVWSLLAGFFVLNERLSPVEWGGCVLLFTAVLTPLIIRFIGERRG